MLAEMKYEGFKDFIVEEARKRYPQASEVGLHTVMKNNGRMLDGLSIMMGNKNTAPTFYLNDLYQDYLAGRPLDDITNSIMRSYEKNKGTEVKALKDFSNFEKVKDQITYRLVNREKNKELLEDVPFVPFADLALVMCMMVELDNGTKGSILLHDAHLRCWGVTVDELMDYAKVNTPHLLTPSYMPIEETIQSMLKDTDAELFPQLMPAFPMYILTNQERMHGAAVVCYPGMLAKLAEKIGGDFYVLPSSIHEVIIAPSQPEITMEDLTDMVADVNATQVTTEEVLSDHAYFYSKERARLEW